jgi:hypothetical protein
MAGKMTRASAVLLILGLLTTGVVSAKGGPSKVTISGPGLVDVVEVTDPKLLQAFEFYRFENISRRIEAPADPGEGYVITRYVRDGRYPQDEAKLIAWDRAIYYPGSAGEVGVVFLEGLIGPNSNEFDGYWYRATGVGDTAMQQILAEHVAMPAQETPWTTPFRITPTTVFAVSVLALVALAHRLAYASPHIIADAVEVTEFPELGDRYHVMGVPRTVIDEVAHVEGALPEGMLLAKLIAAQQEGVAL